MFRGAIAGLFLNIMGLAAVAVAADPADVLQQAGPHWISLDEAEAQSDEVATGEDSSSPVDDVEFTSWLDGPLAPCDGCDASGCDGVASSGCDNCWLSNDEPLLKDYRNRTLIGGLNYSVGGQLRYRYLDERNRLRPQGTLARDTYQQWRFTPFLEVGNDWIKGYARAIDAPTFGEDIPVLPIDVNRFDMMEYYIDARLAEMERGDLRGRYGRMTLLYGDQHLISPLAWSNTFRTFEGGKLYFAGENWNVDGFVMRPSNGAASASVFRPESFDQADQSVLFSGVYATYKKAKNGTLDLFWLWNDEDEPSFAGGFGFNRQDGSRHTIGARYAGSYPVKDCNSVLRTWNWNMQGGWQVGEDDFAALTDQDVSAGFISAIGGVTFDRLPWRPTITGLFWWGSGDSDPNDGDINTVNTLYPLGHAYWGQIDNFNGANLLDYSIQLTVKPAKKLAINAQMHWFDKASANDYIYNIAGAPLGNTTTADRHIGNELDLVATYQVNSNLQVQLGYFWFWYGDAVEDQPALARDDAQQFYLMTTWGF